MELFVFDDDYVRRLKGRDPSTEEHFYAYFRDQLRSKLTRTLPTADLYDDILQETCRRVLTTLDNVRDGRRFGAYVNSFAEKVKLEMLRDSRRTVQLEDAHENIRGGVDLFADLVTAETKARVHRALARMSGRDAEILRGIYIDEEPKDELCQRLSVDRKYLRVLLHRAKERFRAALSIPRTPLVTFGFFSSLWL